MSFSLAFSPGPRHNPDPEKHLGRAYDDQTGRVCAHEHGGPLFAGWLRKIRCTRKGREATTAQAGRRESDVRKKAVGVSGYRRTGPPRFGARKEDRSRVIAALAARRADGPLESTQTKTGTPGYSRASGTGWIAERSSRLMGVGTKATGTDAVSRRRAVRESGRVPFRPEVKHGT